jgi:hypothetical protein
MEREVWIVGNAAFGSLLQGAQLWVVWVIDCVV